MKDELTERQRRFCEEYIANTGNGAQAAIAAGYSKRGADVRAAELLGIRKVQDYLEHLRKEQQARTGVTADRILQELALLAFFDPKDAFDKEGKLLSVHTMPERFRRAIAGFEIKTEYGYDPECGKYPEGYTHKFKLPGKIDALKLLMQHMGMLKEKVELETGPSLAELLRKAGLAAKADGGHG